MILSDNTKKVIDTFLTYDEDIPNRFYSVGVLESKIIEPIRVLDVLEELSVMGMLQWGDKQHTGFRLLESARSYKNIQHLENKERWKERLIGFASGVILTVAAWVLNIIVS